MGRQDHIPSIQETILMPIFKIVNYKIILDKLW